MTTTPKDLTTIGPLFRPGSDGYDDERTGFQRAGLHRPALVVGAAGPDDVRAAVEHAAAHRLSVTVQASGHGLGRAVDGGVLVSTHRMARVQVDPGARTARVEAGATWQHVINAAAPHGLAPLSGSSPGVGTVSYTLGGGVGLLARRYGFAADHVRRIDVVTPDGRPREVTADIDPELFWALRGGGANFGVVTAMEIDLVPVATIVGGGLYLEVAQVPDVLDAWCRWTATVPEEMTSAVAMLVFPDLPMVPELLRGKHVAQIQISYAGEPDAAAALLAPLRELGPLLRDTVRELPYTESATVFDEPDRPHAYRSENRLVDTLGPDALATLTATAGPAAPVMCVVGLRHLGGALARPPRIPNAVGHRDAAYSLTVLSPLEPGTDDDVRDLHRTAVAPFAGAVVGRSLNFSYGPLDDAQVLEAFAPDDHRRLARLKARLDPDGLVRANHPVVGSAR